jgi:hypothetical protein
MVVGDNNIIMMIVENAAIAPPAPAPEAKRMLKGMLEVATYKLVRFPLIA